MSVLTTVLLHGTSTLCKLNTLRPRFTNLKRIPSLCIYVETFRRKVLTPVRPACPPGFTYFSLSGALHEYNGHECLKSSLAFRKPAVAVVSRCPARTEGP